MSLRWRYEAVPGFFAQDAPNANLEHSTAILPRFGLSDAFPTWTAFKSRIDGLNANADYNTAYKVLFLGRHGEGFHNVAMAKYGLTIRHYKNGDGEIIWGPDPELTDVGEREAADAHSKWVLEKEGSIPIPGKIYCSPLTRALRTNEITFNGLAITNTVILENLREKYGIHTYDKRRSGSYIRNTFPTFSIEDGFTEEDELWTAEQRESPESVAFRARTVLDRIFGFDDETYISITAHSGTFRGLLSNISGRAHYEIPTGGILPLVIKGTLSEL